MISINKNPFFSITSKISPEAIEFIYSFNFCSAFILCFGLITYFANNNDKYIANLISHRHVLEKEINLRNRSEELLKKSLNEREILLAEVHHRVKNNLAIISALINLQKDKLSDDVSKQIFEETKNRVYAMSLIHNLLYQNNSFAKIDFVEYVGKFCENISRSYQSKCTIEFEQQIDNINLDIKTAIPLGLILNELITNSLKHAFNNQNSGKITIGLTNIGKTHYKFWVSDSGVGMDHEMINSTSSMGMNIVKSLVEQIDGEINYERDNGSNFTITIPVN